MSDDDNPKPKNRDHACVASVWRLDGFRWLCTECGRFPGPIYPSHTVRKFADAVDFTPDGTPIYPSAQAEEVLSFYSLTSADAFRAFWDVHDRGEQHSDPSYWTDHDDD